MVSNSNIPPSPNISDCRWIPSKPNRLPTASSKKRSPRSNCSPLAAPEYAQSLYGYLHVPFVYPGVVTVGGMTRAVTNGIGVFTYDTPVLSVIKGQGYFALNENGYEEMKVTGLNFGAADWTQTTQLADTFCATASWTSGTSIWCYSLPGEGVLPLESIVGALLDNDYRGSFDLQVWSEEFWGLAPETAIRASCDSMLQLGAAVSENTIAR